MKFRKKALLAINLLLASIVGILINVLAANFPVLPPFVLWGSAGTMIIIFIIVNVVVMTQSEDKADEEGAKTQSKHVEESGRSSHNSTSKNRQKFQQTQQTTHVAQHSSRTISTAHQPLNGESGQPTVDKPLLLCLAIDVSRSMRKPIIDHTGKAIQRWASIEAALEEFIYLGAAWVKDPGTQRVLPLYRLTAYGFGFREVVHSMGARKTPGGAVRDLLAHPSLPSLPSASDLSEHWQAYKERLLTWK
jgi:hypothetical protein